MKRFVLILLRFVPIVAAFCCATNSISSCLGHNMVWLGYVMHGAMMMTWIALAILFRFCFYYFMLVIYVLLNELINTIDAIKPLPISDWNMFVFQCGLIGFTIIIATIVHVYCQRRNKNSASDVPHELG